VDDLVGKNLLIQAGNNTLLNGDISMTGLPDINQTFIDFKANDFRTTYQDAVAFVPAIKRVTVPNLRQLQFIRFNGSYTGFIRDFVTFGTIQTNLGIVKSDLNMKLPSGKEPVYSGTISTEYFRLGEFIGNKNIGAISINGSVKGRGFSEQTRLTEIDGKVHFVDYKGYRYDNLAINGKLDKKKFEGIASINDDVTELTLNGLIDFNSKTPVFNFLADVKKVNLKKLNLTNKDIGFTGKLNLNFSGSTIDDFLGNATIREASLTRNGIPLPFDSLIISSEFADNVKTLTARSNEFDASIRGVFTIRDLPDAVKLFLNKYYPAYIQPPRSLPENQVLTFDVTTRNVEDYLRMADSSLSGFNNSHIYGDLDTRSNELKLTAEVPQFKYGKYNFDNVDIVALGNRDSLALRGGVANIHLSDSVNIPHVAFRVNAHEDTSRVQISTGASQAIRQADINGNVLTYNNGVKIEFDPSSFVVNGKTWTIEENSELEFRKNIPASGQMVLKESNQEIRVKTQPAEIGDWNDVVVDLKKVNVGDFSPLFLPKNRLEGLVSGSILIEDPANNLYASSDNIMAEGLRMDNDSIGNIKTSVVYDNKTKKLKVNGNTLDEPTSLVL
jgi:hypothetical protein